MDAKEIKRKVDILTVLEWYGANISQVDDRREWSTLLCPFHDDTDESGAVSVDRQRFVCFACEASGDIFDLVGNAENVGFKEARDWIVTKFC